MRAIALSRWPLLVFALGVACEDDAILAPPGEPVALFVSGRVFDHRGLPAEGASVALEPQGLRRTADRRGGFEAERVAVGPTRVVVDFEPPTERCLEVGEVSFVDLGDIYEGMPSNCDRPRACAGDRDCDGLADVLEQRGWRVLVTLGDRTEETREVTGDPSAYDSDLDGLGDGEEYAARLDPRARDTDGDLLTDYAEMIVHHSLPTVVDSDGDACPSGGAGFCVSDPTLWDGFEIQLLRTSPTLADTDGDGLGDFDELNSGGTNPRIADLPQLDLRLFGNPLIEVEVDYQTGTSLHSQALEREEEERVDTDNVSTKMSIENTVTLHTEAEAGTSNWPPTFNAKLTTDTKFQHGYFHDTSSSWKKSSVQESKESYEAWEKTNVSFDNGRLSVAMKLKNRSDLSFLLEDLRIVAYRLEGGGSFSLIGTMEPDAAWPTGGQILGPGGELTITATLEHIGAEVMRALVKNPTAMTFEVASYSLFQLDDLGVEKTVNYAKLGESVVQRTGLVVIDFGDGRVERRMIATSVYRNRDGSAWGIPLSEALAELGVDYETTVATSSTGVPGRRVFARIEDRAAFDTCLEDTDPTVDCARVRPRGFWLIGGSGEDFRPGADGIDVTKLRLESGRGIHLTYNVDQDGDGVFDREEYLLGTDERSTDTDGDGLTDYEETRVGWDVTVHGADPYEVFPDPRFRDVDGDFLSDRTELFLGSDPYSFDTDRDGDNDTIDSDPLSPPCLDGESIGLTAWYDGGYEVRGTEYWATDAWTGTADDFESDGRLTASDPSSMLNEIAGDLVFQMNSDVAARDQVIEVETHASLSPQHELTVSAWIYWQGIGAGSDWATLLTKGAWGSENYQLAISKSGLLRFSLLRNLHDKCWHCSFGSNSLCVDWSCADSDYDEHLELLSPAAIPAQEWHHVAASFGGEVMRLYVDGVAVASLVTSSVRWSGWNKYQTTTNRLVTSERPLRIGLDDGAPPIAPFRGLVDDVQLSLRSVAADQLQLLYTLGICEPKRP